MREQSRQTEKPPRSSESQALKKRRKEKARNSKGGRCFGKAITPGKRDNSGSEPELAAEKMAKTAVKTSTSLPGGECSRRPFQKPIAAGKERG